MFTRHPSSAPLTAHPACETGRACLPVQIRHVSEVLEAETDSGQLADALTELIEGLRICLCDEEDQSRTSQRPAQFERATELLLQLRAAEGGTRERIAAFLLDLMKEITPQAICRGGMPYQFELP